MPALMYFQMGISTIIGLIILLIIDHLIRKYFRVLSDKKVEGFEYNELIPWYRIVRGLVFLIFFASIGLYMFKSLSLNVLQLRSNPDRSAVEQQTKEFEQNHKEIQK